MGGIQVEMGFFRTLVEVEVVNVFFDLKRRNYLLPALSPFWSPF